MAQKDASGARRCPEAAFGLDLRPDFRWPQLEVLRKQGDNWRRSLGADKGENRIFSLRRRRNCEQPTQQL